MSRCALVVFVVANRWGPALMTADDQDKIRNIMVGNDGAHQPHHRNGITSHPDPKTGTYKAKDDLVVAIVTHASTVQSFSSSYYPTSTFLAYPTSSSTLSSPRSSKLTPAAHTASPSLRSHHYQPRAHLSNPPRQLQLSTNSRTITLTNHATAPHITTLAAISPSRHSSTSEQIFLERRTNHNHGRHLAFIIRNHGLNCA